jgi:hypothetical protein
MSTEETMIEKALNAAKNRARAEWEDNRTGFESLEAEMVASRPRSAGGEYYDIQVNALISDTVDNDIRGSEEMTMTIHFDQHGEPVFSNVKATLWREDED